MPTKGEKTKPQRERFIETARQLECDEDQERFETKLGKIAKAKPPKPGISQKANN
jgi:hypothetical protein